LSQFWFTSTSPIKKPHLFLIWYIELIKWIVWGAALYAGCLSVVTFCETIYLLYKINRYFLKRPDSILQTRARNIKVFAGLSIAVILIDLVGISLYLTQDKTVFFFVVEIMHLRVIMLVYEFLQLRDITLAKEKSESKLEPEEPIRHLSVQKQEQSIFAAATVRSLPAIKTRLDSSERSCDK
jgi:uncharacterized membrane protein YbhN (UPF0104 family)